MAHTRLDKDGRISRVYNRHIENEGGVFTPTTRRRLISLAKKPRSGARENDFWYDTRKQVRNAVSDLKMISDIASDRQLEQMFGLQGRKDFDEKKQIYKHEDLNGFLYTLLFSQKTRIDKDEHWRYRLAVGITEVGLGYFYNKEGFNTKLHQRSFQEILDAIRVNYSRQP